jgi:hypothetical protein
LTLREGELDSRLRDRDRTIEDLNLRLRELTSMQATRDSLTRRLTSPARQLLARRQPQTRAAKARTPPKSKGKMNARRAGPFRNPTKRLKGKKSAARQRK